MDPTAAGAPTGRQEARGWGPFNRLWLGQGVSQFGTAVAVVALPLVAVLTLHATPLQVGLLTSAEYVAYMGLGLVAGALVDRWDRRGVLLVTDLARALLTAGVPLLAWRGDLRMWHLYLLAVVLGVLSLFFETAYQAYLPAVLSRERLVAGNGRLHATASTMKLAGPSAGGALVQTLGAATTLLVDAASYLVSFAAVLSIRSAAAPPRPRRGEPLRTQIADGIRYVRGDRFLPGVLGMLAYSNLIIAAEQALLVVFLVRAVHAAPGQVGVLLATGGAGAVLGALAAPRLVRRLGPGTTLILGAVGSPLFGLLVPLTRPGPGLLLFAVGSAGMTGSTIAFNVVGQSYRQASIPPHLIGRVVATMRTVTWGTLPFGGLLGGLLGQYLGPRGGLSVLAGALLLGPLWLARSGVWRLDFGDVGMADPRGSRPVVPAQPAPGAPPVASVAQPQALPVTVSPDPATPAPEDPTPVPEREGVGTGVAVAEPRPEP
jgi:MFS family permease